MNGTTVDPTMNKFKKIPQVNPSQDTIKISFVSGYLFVSVAIFPPCLSGLIKFGKRGLSGTEVSLFLFAPMKKMKYLILIRLFLFLQWVPANWVQTWGFGARGSLVRSGHLFFGGSRMLKIAGSCYHEEARGLALGVISQYWDGNAISELFFLFPPYSPLYR